MKWTIGRLFALSAALLLLPAATFAASLGVEISTDRGHQAVYQPGDGMEVKLRVTEDAHLLVYEIDSEGYVRVLFPAHSGDDLLEGRTTLSLPGRDSHIELVVEQSTGQSYLVAIASIEPFGALPWYLRRPDAQGQELGYVNAPPEEEGITTEGRIVGDPFVSMERIRRAVLGQPENEDLFATAYTSYFVEQAVRYPRYLCYDCHRPNQYSFWDGFDPYYSTCSVFDFRVNWSWHWGPRYWYGTVPYYVYVYRTDCPPAYYGYAQTGAWYSSWDGWNRWCNLWGQGGLRRYKSDPPPGYVSPTQWKPNYPDRGPQNRVPPGFMVSNTRRYRDARPVAPNAGGGGGGPETVGQRTGRPTTVERPIRDPNTPPVSVGDRVPRGRTDPAPRPDPATRDNAQPRVTPVAPPATREPRQGPTPRQEPAEPAPRSEPAQRRETPPPAPRGDVRPPRSESGRQSSPAAQRSDATRSMRSGWSAPGPGTRSRDGSLGAQLDRAARAGQPANWQPARPSTYASPTQRRSTVSQAPRTQNGAPVYTRSAPTGSAPQRSNWSAPAPRGNASPSSQRSNASFAPRAGGGGGGRRSGGQH